MLRIVEPEDLQCKAFPYGIPIEILDGSHDHREPFPGDNGIHFEPIAPPRKHQDPEFHHFAVELRRLHRAIITSEELSEQDARLAAQTVLAWASGKLAKDWVRERKINAAQAQRLKDACVWPW